MHSQFWWRSSFREVFFSDVSFKNSLAMNSFKEFLGFPIILNVLFKLNCLNKFCKDYDKQLRKHQVTKVNKILFQSKSVIFV